MGEDNKGLAAGYNKAETKEQKMRGLNSACIQLGKSTTDLNGSRVQSRSHVPEGRSTTESAEEDEKGVHSTEILMPVVPVRQSKARNEELQATLVAAHPRLSTNLLQFFSFWE